MNKRRNISLDITRIVAVLAVVMVHTSADFVDDYDIQSSEFMWGNIFDSISRIGAPLFVMVSGALMLDVNRNINMKNLFFRNIKNIVCLLIFWSVLYGSFYNIIYPLIKGKPLNLSDIIKSMVMGHYHMWYLYMIIGLYLITPFLRAFVKKENKHLILMFILISLITQFSQPILNALSRNWGGAVELVNWIKKFNLGFFGGYTIYYIVGWYIVHVGIKKKWRIYCLGIISLLVIMLYVKTTKDHINGYSYTNMFVFFYSVAVFMALNCKKEWKINDRLKSFIQIVSKLSFAIYIVHPLLQTIVSRIYAYTKNPAMYIWSYFGVVIMLSFVGCYIVSKIPIMKKIVRA